MEEDTISRIKEAEKKAVDIISKAKEEAGKMLAGAHEKTKKIIEEKVASAHRQAKELIEKAIETGEKEAKKIMGDTEKQRKALAENAKKKIHAAVAMVMEEIKKSFGE